MIAIVKFKRLIVNVCIFCIIVSKFSYWKEFSLIILLIVDKNLEVGLHYIVLSLILVINLRVKDDKESLLDF